MRAERSGALMFHGATDDVAFEKIFPPCHGCCHGWCGGWCGGAPDPDATDPVACARDARRVREKPVGTDLDSARRLNAVLHQQVDERAIFRIDPFLGKEAVQNLVFFRFANTFLEPTWSRHDVANVQIAMAQPFGVEGRDALSAQTGLIGEPESRRTDPPTVHELSPWRPAVEAVRAAHRAYRHSADRAHRRAPPLPPEEAPPIRGAPRARRR